MRRRNLISGKEPFNLSLSPTSYTASDKSSYKTFTILSNGETYTGNDVLVSSNQTWATVTNNSGVVRVNYTENNGSSNRTATITVTVQGVSATFTLTQTYIRIITSLPYDGTIGGYKYITIGTQKWAVNNIGASSDGAYGEYYMWGESVTHSTYYGEYYKYGDCSSVSTLTKYNNSDGLTTLESTDDTATQLMGSSWRMPTISECSTLVSNSNYELVKYRSGSTYIRGSLFTSKTNSSKYVFFPAAGSKFGGGGAQNVGSDTGVWSSSLYTSDKTRARIMQGANTGAYTSARYLGKNVRGIAV